MSDRYKVRVTLLREFHFKTACFWVTFHVCLDYVSSPFHITSICYMELMSLIGMSFVRADSAICSGGWLHKQ